LRDDGSDLTVQSGNLVIVPIPMSGPTLDSGLILGEMYFHGQTEEQAKKQPASVTGGAGMYNSSIGRMTPGGSPPQWVRPT